MHSFLGGWLCDAFGRTSCQLVPQRIRTSWQLVLQSGPGGSFGRTSCQLVPQRIRTSWQLVLQSGCDAFGRTSCQLVPQRIRTSWQLVLQSGCDAFSRTSCQLVPQRIRTSWQLVLQSGLRFVRHQPTIFAIWGNSVSITSGRFCGSFNCSGVAASEPLSPANNPVRMPTRLAGAISRATFEPICSVSCGSIPFSLIRPQGCPEEILRRFAAAMLAREPAACKGDGRIQIKAVLLTLQSALQLDGGKTLAVGKKALLQSCFETAHAKPPPLRGNTRSPEGWHERSRPPSC